MYVISAKTVDNNWVYATVLNGPGYTIAFNDAEKFKSIKDAKKFWETNKTFYENLTDVAVRKIIFKKKVNL